MSIKRAAELVLLFVLLPISLCLNFYVAIKMGLVLIGCIYVALILKKDGLLRVTWSTFNIILDFLKQIIGRFLLIVLVSTLYVHFLYPEKLFIVVVNKPWLWATILIVYTLFSVVPQELIYRTFFFARYEKFFQNKYLFILVSAIIFSLAHLFFLNPLVQLLTFIGGLLFAYTYHNTRSTFLVSLEHAIYGNWLFTVGLGEMLAFPG
ncbi:CPBP family intramembrane glutamic endopeptidase [Aquimarina brevivitae]|uniref:CAAX prenyl protease-like protein n=1 Tax=Aquimarina brevivitae TaxID=323412 RepID=A0A4Q7NTY2_9FLAO|nr:CPBP family intramembrane glutamic endopeptidase [Aquimarina brevivitae]RZS90494.1 CAAX prenyl protease-like protein [Aquimarina brevivitae]